MPQQATWEDLILAGLELKVTENRTQWAWGDLALQVEVGYGEHSLEKFAEEVGVEFGNLQDYRRVAAAYEKSARAGNLSWRHHRLLASRPDRLEWLARAAEHGWSTRRLQEEVQLADNPPAPKDLVEQLKASVAGGSDPVEVTNEALKTYGPFPPEMAREVARAFDLTLVPGSDNRLHDGRSLEQIDVEVVEISRQGELFEALRHLAQAEVSPQAEAQTIPDYMRDDVDPHLAAALEWLLEFKKAWEERWQVSTSSRQ